ncbi:hypothetical protein LY76DRAFT_152713 [Colletotrichum caudatum]|nr:hypothetical protein LY76DRAFT_152713 [Colletotrichum caudatum]
MTRHSTRARRSRFRLKRAMVDLPYLHAQLLLVPRPCATKTALSLSLAQAKRTARPLEKEKKRNKKKKKNNNNGIRLRECPPGHGTGAFD